VVERSRISRRGRRVAGLLVLVAALVAPGTVLSAADVTAPHVSPPVVRIRSEGSGVGFGSVVQATVSISGSDAGSGFGTGAPNDPFVLAVSRNGGSFATISITSVRLFNNGSTLTAVVKRSLALSGTYRFRTRMRDRAGNWSGWVAGPTISARIVEDSSSSMRYSSGWTSVHDARWSGGSLRSTTFTAATAVLTFTGRSIGWVTHRDLASGQAQVWIDGVLEASISLNTTGQTSLGRLVVFSKTWATSGTHKIAIKVLGTPGHPKVDHDAFLILH
jgi:hypothetical protein